MSKYSMHQQASRHLLRQKGRHLFWIVAAALAGMSCATLRQPKPDIRRDVQLEELEGVWHEHARLPQGFTRNCAAVSLSMQADGPHKMRITSYCWYKSMNGPMRRADATATVGRKRDRSGRIWIRFAGPFVGEYGVLYLSEDGRQMIMGAPDRRNLWIMSRDVRPDKTLIADLVLRAKHVGYDTSALIYGPGGAP